MDGGEKRGSVLGVSCGNPSPLFQMEKGVFHQMPELIEMLVVMPLMLPTFLGRDDGFHVFLLGLFNNRIGIIGAISQETLGIDPLYKAACLCAIRCGTCCNKNSDRHTMRIHGQMYLGVEPPFVRSIS